MKRKYTTLAPETRHVIALPSGDRLCVSLFPDDRTVSIDFENCRAFRDAEAAGEIKVRGHEETATLIEGLCECLQTSMDYLDAYKDTLPPSQCAKLERHLEICRLTHSKGILAFQDPQ